jgi:predicted site-specific integrase-resolvase
VSRVQEDFFQWYYQKKKICYARVSLDHQKDLERQVKILDRLYPRTAIIKDIGSGLNFKRKSISLLDGVYSREVKEIIVLYNDRL